MNAVWGFLVGKVGAAGCLKPSGFCSSEGGSELGEQKEMKETVMRRVPRQSRDQSPWDTELIMWVKNESWWRETFCSSFLYDQGARTLCSLLNRVVPKVILHLCQPLPKGCSSYRTSSIWGSTWNRGVKHTNTCLNSTSSLYWSCLSVQNRNLLLILLLLPVGPSPLCCRLRRVQ